MKCNSAISVDTKTGKRKGTYGQRVTRETLENWKKKLPKQFVNKVFLTETGELIRCAGKVVAKIEAVEEPYLGGMSASLSVKFFCDTCGWYHDDLPDQEFSLNKWLNESVLSKIK
jgi:hypothetical protein